MQRKYFKVSQKRSSELMDTWRAVTDPLVEKRKDVIEAFKKDFHITGDVVKTKGGWSYDNHIGFTVEESDRTPKWAKREYYYDDDEKRVNYLTPKRNFKRGKEFQAWLSKLNNIKIKPFTSHLVDQLLVGGGQTIAHGMAMHYPVAGFAKGHIVLSIPTNEDVQPEFHGDGIVEIKKSEFIALTEE